MNPINKLTGAITHPLRTATSVAGGAIGVAAEGVRRATRIVDRSSGQGGAGVAATTSRAADGPAQASPAPESPAPESPAPGSPAAETSVQTGPAEKSPDTTSTAQRSAPQKSAPQKAPAKKSAKKSAQKPTAQKSTAQKSTAQKSTAQKSTGKRSTAKRAPSARAATAGPAMTSDTAVPAGAPADEQAPHLETEAEVVYTSETGSAAGAAAQDTLSEPLLDPATAESLRSEAEVLQRAADPDKGKG